VKVILVGATTICGRISPAGLGSQLDRARLEKFRDRTQASIMGANTLRVEDPEMRGTNGALPQDRIRAIITQSGSIPTTGKKLFDQGPGPVVFTAKGNVPTLQDKLKGRAQVISLPEEKHGLSLQAAVNYLAERGVDSILIEGGSHLNYTALAQGVADEILLTVMPFVSGDMGVPCFADGSEQLGDPFLKLELLQCEPVLTGEIFLHYRVTRKG